jgi:signal transduction histidine kinase
VTAAVALALHRTALEALTNARKRAAARLVEIVLAFPPTDASTCACTTTGKGRSGWTEGSA